MKQLSVRTTRREEMVDITAQVAELAAASGLAEGAVLVYCPHTTAGMTINEGADPDVRRDMLSHLAQLVPQHADFRHAEGNSDAHIKTSCMGPSQLLMLSGGRLALGTWQKLYLCEFDGPRQRTLWVQFLATAGE